MSSRLEPQPSEDRLMSVRDVAQFLGVSRNTVYALKDLPSVKIGRQRRYFRSDLEEHLKLRLRRA